MVTVHDPLLRGGEVLPHVSAPSPSVGQEVLLRIVVQRIEMNERHLDPN